MHESLNGCLGFLKGLSQLLGREPSHESLILIPRTLWWVSSFLASAVATALQHVAKVCKSIVRINFQSYSRGEIRLQRLDMHDMIYSQHIRIHKIYIYVTMEDIYTMCLYTYTYHISVLSKLRLDVCCWMSRIQNVDPWGLHRWAEAPEGMPSLVSLPKLSSYFRTPNMDEVRKMDENHNNKTWNTQEVSKVDSFLWEFESSFTVILPERWGAIRPAYFYTTSFSCMFHQPVSHLAGGCNRGFLAGLESPINFTHTTT